MRQIATKTNGRPARTPVTAERWDDRGQTLFSTARPRKRRTGAQLAATVKEIAGHGRRGTAFAADIADEEAVSGVFNAVEDRFGYLDVVVPTAGINRPAALVDLDLADFDEIHRVNVRGTFVVGQQAARRVRDGGSIVNVSSSMVRVAPRR